MTREELVQQIQLKKSYLCTGLDTEIAKLPAGIEKSTEGMLNFNKKIINATLDYSVAYKINTAFYEQYGSAGWELMNETLSFLPDSVLKIADAKRGDIGNTGTMYARAFFENMNFDAITVSPYMGKDSLMPFLEYTNKWTICLALTSNPGHADFQLNKDENQKRLFENVIETVCKYGNENNLMFVCGATRGDDLDTIRKIIPNHFLLIPGVGAQGGNLQEVSKKTLNKDAGILINSSRGIIYASSAEDFEEAAKIEAKKLQQEMSELIS